MLEMESSRMVKNADFFSQKKPWSIIKDDLLEYYLKPYFTKIFHAGSVLYVDGFAGQGYFGDGKKGSPIIALDVLKTCFELNGAKTITPDIQVVFIEQKYADILRENISTHSLKDKTTVIKGEFIRELNNILQDNRQKNLFVYIDPFGIKDLSFQLFNTLSNRQKSLELLINFNSFGFLREACRVMHVSQSLLDEFDRLLDDDMLDDNLGKELDTDIGIQNKLNDIAGGTYWIKIANAFKNKQISALEAEKQMSAGYRKQLKQIFHYVIDLPIKSKQRNVPKYRMVHATNHPDGCILMYDNISRRWDDISLVQSGGQLSLLDSNHAEYSLSNSAIKKILYNHLQQLESQTPINEICASFCTQYGVLCKFSQLKLFLQSFEEDGLIEFGRRPSLTKKGIPSVFMSQNSKQKIWLKHVKKNN